MQKKVVKQLDHIVTVSERSQIDIAKDFSIPQSDIDLIYNGIDTEEFAPIAGIQKIPYRIMCTASADQPLKGLKYLLKAVATLREQYPQMTLLVVGKLNEGGYTEGLIKRLGIADMWCNLFPAFLLNNWCSITTKQKSLSALRSTKALACQLAKRCLAAQR
jgi:glycosyltransferase involved in cell wall biosynthesis